MKKTLLILGSAFCFIVASGQERNPDALRATFERIDATFNQYKDLSSLRELGKESVSDKVIADFSALFDPASVIYGGINLVKDSLGFFALPLYAPTKKIDEYLTEAKLNFTGGFRVGIIKSTIDYSRMSSGEVKMMLERTMSGKTKSMSSAGLKEYFIQSVDTVEMVLGIDPAAFTVFIKGINKKGASINCPDCLKESQDELKRREKLAIKDKKDIAEKPVKEAKPPKQEKLPKPPKPPKEPKPERPAKDSNPKSFDLALLPYLGPGFTAVELSELNKGSLDTDVYTDLIRSKSEISGYSTSGLRSSFSTGANLELMFGKGTQFGFALGILYQSSRSELKLDDYRVEYAAVDAAGVSYNRIVEGTNVEEKIKIRNTTMPLLLRLSLGKGEKLHWHFGVGPVFSLKTKVTSSATALGNFEAVYHRNQNQFAFDPTGNIDDEDWVMTYDAVSALSGEANADLYFQNHQAAGFDIAHKKEFSENEKAYVFNLKSAFLISASAGLSLSPKSELTLGLQYVTSKMTRDGEARYAMFSSTTDDYSSLMEASSQMKTNSFNLLVGIRFLLIEKNP